MNLTMYADAEFDDLVTGNDGTWCYLCKKHAEKFRSHGIISEAPLDKVICGVKGCRNVGKYLIDFEDDNNEESR